MKVLKKILIGLGICLALFLIGFIFYLKATYIDREENGLKYKTYELVNEDGSISSIKLTKDSITFEDIDFLETYKTMATIKLAKENGLEFNTLSQEEKNKAIELEVSEMVYKNVLQRSKAYPYTYYPDTRLLLISSGEYQITLSFSDESFIKFIPTMKKPGLTLYNKLFY